jgi:hypothetical protein
MGALGVLRRHLGVRGPAARRASDVGSEPRRKHPLQARYEHPVRAWRGTSTAASLNCSSPCETGERAGPEAKRADGCGSAMVRAVSAGASGGCCP